MKTLTDNVLRGLTKPALIKTIKELYEENLKLEDKYIHNVPCCNEEDCELFKNYIQLQQRIDEAIEYIKDKGCYEEDTKVFCDDINYDELSKLLDILQGDKEKQ